MPNWKPLPALPDKLGDAFAVLYDWLDGDPNRKIENARGRLGIALELKTRALQELVAASGWWTPPELQAALDATAGSAVRELLEAFRCLLAIDRGAKAYHPRYVTDWPKDDHEDLLSQWRSHGCYNTDAVAGYVLPKWTSVFRTETTLARFCQHLVRVDIDRSLLKVISSQEHGALRSTSVENPRVVIVPFLYSLDDATFFPVDVGGAHFFDVRHRSGAPPILEERLRAAVAAVRDSRANIAIFPELVLNQDLLTVLKRSLRESLSPAAVDLDWVIAGTAVPVPHEVPFQIENRAVVLNGAGSVVRGKVLDGVRVSWEQQKRHRYTLSPEEQQRYELESCFSDAGELCNRDEAIAVRRHGIVFDDPSGCYAVLICEDWARNIDTCEALHRFQPRVVFVIVMDGPTMTHRWAAQRAEDIVAHTDAFVVLANSLLLPNRPAILERTRTKYGVPDSFPGGRQPVGLLYGPPEAATPDDPFPHTFNARAEPDPTDPGSLISNAIAIPLRPP